MHNPEIKSIIQRIENCNAGEPWFGRSIHALLAASNPRRVFEKVSITPGNPVHSLADLLWHMNTWAEFTLNRLQGNKEADLAAAEELDWRGINPRVHTWKKGISTFKELHKKIIRELKTKEDSFLDGKVDYRQYNFRYLLNGLMEHNIYHAGQIAYINKLFS